MLRLLLQLLALARHDRIFVFAVDGWQLQRTLQCDKQSIITNFRFDTKPSPAPRKIAVLGAPQNRTVRVWNMTGEGSHKSKVYHGFRNKGALRTMEWVLGSPMDNQDTWLEGILVIEGCTIIFIDLQLDG
eukprot:gene21217-8016_t